MVTKLDKKSLLCLSIVITSAILVCVGSFYFLSQIPRIEGGEKVIPEKSEKEKIIEQQLQELNWLRENTKPLTEEEIQEQLEELKQIQQKTQPLTEEEIQKQLEELDKLRK